MTPKARKTLSITGITVGAIVLLVITLTALVSTLASSTWGKEKIETVAADVLQAKLTTSSINVSMWSTFPHLRVDITDFQLTSNAIPAAEMEQGADSLVSFTRLTANVNWFSFLFTGRIKVTELTLDNPSANAFCAPSGAANWNIYTSADTTSSAPLSLPPIYLDKVVINNGNIRYTDRQSGMHLTLPIRSLTVKGSYIDSDFQMQIGVKSDSIDFQYTASSLHASIDSLQFDLSVTTTSDSLRVHTLQAPIRGDIVYSDDNLRTPTIPATLGFDMTTDWNFTTYHIHQLDLRSQSLGFQLNGLLQSLAQGWGMNLHWKFKVEDAQHIVDLVPYPFTQRVDGLRAQGYIDNSGTATGTATASQLPRVSTLLDLRMVQIHFLTQPYGIDNLNLVGSALYDEAQPDSSYLNIDEMSLHSGTSYLKAALHVQRLLGNSLIRLNSSCNANLSYLAKVFPPSYNEFFRIAGTMKGTLDTRLTRRQLEQYDFRDIYALGKLNAEKLRIEFPKSDFLMTADGLLCDVGFNSIYSRRHKRNMMLSSIIQFDHMDLHMGKEADFKTSNFRFSGYIDELFKGVPLLRAAVNFKHIDATLRDTIQLYGKQFRLAANIRPDSTDALIPVMINNLRMDSLLFNTPSQSFFIDSTRLQANAKLRSRIFRRMQPRPLATATQGSADSTHRPSARRLRPDSIARPLAQREEVKMDSVIRILMKIAHAESPSDEFLRYFTVGGKANMKILSYASPYLPIATRMNKVNFEFTDDSLNLHSAHLAMGRSDISMQGGINNIRRFLLYGRTLQGTLTVNSKMLDCNEMLQAVYEGRNKRIADEEAKKQERRLKRRKQWQERSAQLDSAARAELIQKMRENRKKMLEAKEQSAQTTQEAQALESLVRIPHNINVVVALAADSIIYSKLKMYKFTGRITTFNSYLNIRNLSTITDIGAVRTNLMYHCPTYEKATIGLDLHTDDVAIGSLIDNLPQLDTIVPMLRSFKGNVDCELSLIADLDQGSNVILPSINAAASLQGEKLVLLDGETFAEIAKMLMFKRKTENVINNIGVEIVVRNNQLEVLPFMLSMDKYRVAIGGEHRFNMSFNYHLSVLKSPIPFAMGIDIKGNLDKFKFNLVSPKYTNEKSVTQRGKFIEGNINVRQRVQQDLKKKIEEAGQNTPNASTVRR